MNLCPSCGQYAVVRCDACRKILDFDPGMAAAKRMARLARTCVLCDEYFETGPDLVGHLIEGHGAA